MGEVLCDEEDVDSVYESGDEDDSMGADGANKIKAGNVFVDLGDLNDEEVTAVQQNEAKFGGSQAEITKRTATGLVEAARSKRAWKATAAEAVEPAPPAPAAVPATFHAAAPAKAATKPTEVGAAAGAAARSRSRSAARKAAQNSSG